MLRCSKTQKTVLNQLQAAAVQADAQHTSKRQAAKAGVWALNRSSTARIVSLQCMPVLLLYNSAGLTLPTLKNRITSLYVFLISQYCF